MAWAREVISAATARMRSVCEESDRPELWGIFEDRLLNPIFKQIPSTPYEQVVARFNLKSPAQASNLLITAKRMFQRCMREIVAEYETEDAQISEELAALDAALARAGAG